MNSRRPMPTMAFLRGEHRQSPPMLDQKDSITAGWKTGLLHCGISVASAARVMAVMGRKPAYPSPRRAGGMSAMTA